MHGTRTFRTALALLGAVTTATIGIMAFPANATASPHTGTLMGTASPCITTAPTDGETFAVHVVLRRGTKVVGTRTVTDVYGDGDGMTTEIFTFKEPAGTYVVTGAATTKKAVVIKKGKTVWVALRSTAA